jgi:hypothetical protein
MTQHTPGPWAVGRKFSTFWIITGYGKDVASVKLSRFVDNSTNEANARLIAAAPDLLECLQHAVNWFDQLNSNDYARYRAAIAKATGDA